MKPFNLNEALQGAKVETRDRQPVTDIKLQHGQVAGFINGLKHVWHIDGFKHNPNNVWTPLDLFMS